MAALSATMIKTGRQSKYMNMAGTLASEKLEDLNHWNAAFSATTGADISDPQICVQAGDTSEGSLISDAPSKSITCNGITETIGYSDNVSIDVTNSSDCPNPADGCFAESTYTTTGGTTTYSTTYHSPDGSVVNSNTAPTFVTFHRRWLIEANPVVVGATGLAGVRRITVLVTLQDLSVGPNNNTPLTFQMSVVK
jgi:hypothetical protein